MKLKVLLKNKNKQYVRSKNEINKKRKNDKCNDKYVRNGITEQVIKNCKGVRQCNDGINRLDKEKQREKFRQLLGFRENEVFECKEYSIVKGIKKNI